MKTAATLIPTTVALAFVFHTTTSFAQVIPATTQRARVEADWLSAATLRSFVDSTGTLTTELDAAGACDGIVNGGWGFHTGNGPDSWWQVDLEQAQSLERVLLYNRADGTAGRAAHIRLLTSNDGRSWTPRYRHDGSTFYGHTDGAPLSIPLDGLQARFIRLQLTGADPLHLDEVEVYGSADPGANLALGRPANQSSTSEWSTLDAHGSVGQAVAAVLERGLEMAEALARTGVEVEESVEALQALAERASHAPQAVHEELYSSARKVLRQLTFADPLLAFDDLLFVQRVPGSFSHMSDQYYGWWSRPGGGLYILRDFKGPSPKLECLSSELPEGSVLRPDLSPDGRRVVFAFARYYPELSDEPDKLNKDHVPEDGFYHLYEVNVDGSGLRRLTRGRYDDFDARYLPSGEIVFLSTRRGQFFQVGTQTAAATQAQTLPDCYVRCGGDQQRPVAVYTLHVMDGDGADLRPISPFEMFEWTPSVAADGSILYSRWDYIDRDNMPFMGLWSTRPDGTGARLVYGNHAQKPHSMFEPRQVPGSQKIVFTASAHHSITGGSLVLLDTTVGLENPGAMQRLTPEVCFPEVEGWPSTYYANPWPLSERAFLVAWSDQPLVGQSRSNPDNALGLYVYNASGHRELIHRDPKISSMYPIPLRPRAQQAPTDAIAEWDGPQEGRFLVQDIYRGLEGVARGSIKHLRIVGVPAKTQPDMNIPVLGVTRDDPGKCVLGTVPVEADGSAFFRVPSGVSLFFQALDEDGLAVQTMRSATYVQPGETASCIGCHESRGTAPPATDAPPLALAHAPSKIRLGPEGSWPLRFDRLVQPVLDRECVSCHEPGSGDALAAAFDLSTPETSYPNLVACGEPSLTDLVMKRYLEGASTAGACIANRSALLALVREPGAHYGVTLGADDLERLVTWMDTYAQLKGAFSAAQEAELRMLRERWSKTLVERR